MRWSNKLAYCVGLLLTDGHLSKDGRHIDLTSKDMEQLETFKKCLGLKVKIGSKSTGRPSKVRYPRIQFGDVKFYRWLLSIGFVQNKTYGVGALKIPDRYFSHFLRGFYDGDGCSYSYFDPRWRSSFMFYTNFIAKSEKHIKWLRDTIKRLVGINGRINYTSRVYKIQFAKKESRIIIDYMYKNADKVYLTRKYDKIMKIFQTDAEVEKLVYSLP